MTLSDTSVKPDVPAFMSLEAVAKQLGLSWHIVRDQLIQPAGPLPVERIGKSYYVPAAAVRDYVDSITSRTA